MEIKFSNVSYKTILQNINIAFQSNRINGLIGRSGSGKTTLVELIDALRLPTNGEIMVDNITIHQKFKMKNINDLRINIGLVYEFPEEQFFSNTVREELVFGLKNFNIDSSTINARIEQALNSVGLDCAYLDRDPFTLSHGEKRKVAIASILSFDPSVLILDEPLLGLDGESQKQIMRLIKTLQTKSKKTVIIVSQNTELIYKLCDYIYLIDQGKCVLEGKKYEIFTKEEVKEYGITIPKIITFVNNVKSKKKIDLGYRDDINDLIKDVYRYVR